MRVATILAVVSAALLLGLAAPAFAQHAHGASMSGYAHGGGIGAISPFTSLTGLPSYTGVGRAGAVGERAAQYEHVGGSVSGAGGSSGLSGATMHGTATGGASRLYNTSPFIGAGSGHTGGASGM
jgi:hypothetical protein